MSAVVETGVRIRVDGSVGRITLDRPKALNAITPAGVDAMAAALDAWERDPAVALVAIDGAGDRAFSAGGDIQAIYQAGRAGDFAMPRRFWVEEYRLNARLASYPKPLVSLMAGIAMGGGLGIGMHARLRLVTQTSLLAMPEVAIGLMPDAGGLWRLSRAPGRLGEYLGMTGARMGPGDAIAAGFADHFLWDAPAAAVDALVAAGDAAALSAFYGDAPAGPLTDQRSAIDRIFALPSGPEILAALDAEGAPWADTAAAQIRSAAPLSVACALEAIRAARAMASMEETLALELRFTWRSIESGDLLEGIRALVIDKDKQPRWRHPALEAVAPADVAAMLAPLGAQDLTFPSV